ncbi:hypothetical protein [Alsobacter sp. R-9]
MRRFLVVAAGAGALALLAMASHAVLTSAAGGSGATAAWARTTCTGCHR